MPIAPENRWLYPIDRPELSRLHPSQPRLERGPHPRQRYDSGAVMTEWQMRLWRRPENRARLMGFQFIQEDLTEADVTAVPLSSCWTCS